MLVGWRHVAPVGKGFRRPARLPLLWAIERRIGKWLPIVRCKVVEGWSGMIDPDFSFELFCSFS